MRPVAVSKSTVLSQLSDEVERVLETAIPVINKKLTNFSEGGSVIVYVGHLGKSNLSGDVLKRVVEEIKKEFEGKGWNVKFTYGDQRDNDDWFTFS